MYVGAHVCLVSMYAISFAVETTSLESMCVHCSMFISSVKTAITKTLISCSRPFVSYVYNACRCIVYVITELNRRWNIKHTYLWRASQIRYANNSYCAELNEPDFNDNDNDNDNDDDNNNKFDGWTFSGSTLSVWPNGVHCTHTHNIVQRSHK